MTSDYSDTVTESESGYNSYKSDSYEHEVVFADEIEDCPAGILEKVTIAASYSSSFTTRVVTQENIIKNNKIESHINF